MARSQPELMLESTYEEESVGDMVMRQIRTKPIVISGVSAFMASLGYGYYKYRTQGTMGNTSLFLLQLRVGAQTAAIACITVGMLHNLYNRLSKTEEKK